MATSSMNAQTVSNVQATTWFTAAQSGAVKQGHHQHLFLEQEVAGGNPFTDRYYQELTLSADLRKGRMKGAAAILNPFQVPGRRTEHKAHFQPRYRVERALGNTNTSTVIPVQWTVRLKDYAVNYTGVASGSSDAGSTRAQVLLSAQSPNAGGILAQVIYQHQTQVTGQQPISFTTDKTVQTAGPSQVREGWDFDPVSEKLTNYFKVATANNGNSLARIDHPPDAEDRTGFSDVFLTVRHNALPGNGLSFLLWLEMDTVASAYGTGTALNWKEFDLRYSVPPGYQLVAVDGQDLSGLDEARVGEGAPADVQTLSSWEWRPDQNRLVLSFAGVAGKALEVQESTDLNSGWDTIKRIENALAGELLEAQVPGGRDDLNVPVDRRFYRVITVAPNLALP